MITSQPKKNKVSISLGDSTLESHIARAVVDRSLSEVGKLTVQIAPHPQVNYDRALGIQNQRAQIEYGGEIYFKGYLKNITPSSAGLELLFLDPLHLAKNMKLSVFYKAQSLKSVLEDLIGRLGLSLKLVGSFKRALTTFSTEGRSLFENLTLLSQTFGFFFYFNPNSGEVVFIQAGHSTDAVTLSDKQPISRFELSSDSGQFINELRAQHYCIEDRQPKQKVIQTASVASQLGSLATHASFQKRQSNFFAGGRVEKTMGNSAHFEHFEQDYSNLYSMHLLLNEQLQLESLEKLASVGQNLEVNSGNLTSEIQGSFFIQRNLVVFEGPHPQYLTTMVRA